MLWLRKYLEFMLFIGNPYIFVYLKNRIFNYGRGQEISLFEKWGKVTITLKEAKIINESNTKESLEFDVQWYLSHGYVTLEEFEKNHPIP